MTCEAGKQGEGTAPAAVPRPGSCEAAAAKALAEFAFEERLVGAAKAHESFDGILAEHALALEEARDMLREGLAQGRYVAIGAAIALIDDQIKYVRALGSVAQKEEKTDGAG